MNTQIANKRLKCFVKAVSIRRFIIITFIMMIISIGIIIIIIIIIIILLYSHDPDTMVDPSGDIATEVTV